jgi:hypothetical protein
MLAKPPVVTEAYIRQEVNRSLLLIENNQDKIDRTKYIAAIAFLQTILDYFRNLDEQNRPKLKLV